MGDKKKQILLEDDSRQPPGVLDTLASHDSLLRIFSTAQLRDYKAWLLSPKYLLYKIMYVTVLYMCLLPPSRHWPFHKYPIIFAHIHIP